MAIGETWEDFKKRGQDELLLKNNYSFYAKSFSKTLVFAYGKESFRLLPKVYLIGTKNHFHRFLYAFLLPFIHRRELLKLPVLRGMQLSSIVSLFLSKLVNKNKIVLNYGYDYIKTALVEGKLIHAFLYFLLEIGLLRFADCVIVPNKRLHKRVKSSVKCPVIIISNGVNTRLFRPLHSISKTIDLLFVGRLEKQKNLTLIIDAASEMVYANLKVTFIGNGSEILRLKQYAKEKKVKLRIIQRVPNSKLTTYYNSSRIFVLPSLIEGNPKVLLEAMSCGIPAIGTNVEGINDVIVNNDNGKLIAPKTILLQQAIEKLLTDRRLYRKMSRCARRTIEQIYESHTVWSQEIKLLNNLAK